MTNVEVSNFLANLGSFVKAGIQSIIEEEQVRNLINKTKHCNQTERVMANTKLKNSFPQVYRELKKDERRTRRGRK